MTPRSLRSMNFASNATSSPSSSRIFSRACVVFSFDASRSRNAFCSALIRSALNPAPLQPNPVHAEGLVLAPRRSFENGSTSCVTIVPPPINAYFPTVQNWCTGLNAPTVAKSSMITCPASVAAFARMQPLPTMQSCPMCTRGHQQVLRAHPRDAAALRRSAADRHALANRIVVADLASASARRHTSDPAAPFLPRRTDKTHSALRYACARPAPRAKSACNLRPAPHPARSSKTAPPRRSREPPLPRPPPRWDGCSLRHRLRLGAFTLIGVVSAASPCAFRSRGTTAHVSVASHASLPSTVAGHESCPPAYGTTARRPRSATGRPASPAGETWPARSP